MASRGSALSRAVKYFEEGDLREVRVAFQLVKETVEARLGQSAQAKLPFAKKARKARKPRVSEQVMAEMAKNETLANA